uniref:Uncharacterized protein n=1 Tax=Plectus sambesii TaxID=2011161 RepID=A0A914W5J4_9BILA
MLSENLRNLLRERYSIFTPHMERQAKLLLLAVVLIFVGLIFNLIAIFTPAWQVGYVERMNDTIENGLWLHCENSPLIGTGCVTLFDKIPSTTARSFTDFLHLSRQKDKKDEADYSVEDSFPFIDRTGMHSSNFE